MKILRVVSELDFGGVEQVLGNSLPRLVKMKGLEVFVLVLGKGGRISQSLEAEGIKIEIFNHNPRIPNLKSLFRLIKIFKSFKPNVLHCQGSEANFHGLIAARIAGVPVRIGEEIGFPNHHSYWKYIFRLVYKNATKVIAISQAVKDRIVELEEVEEGKVEVVYNPVIIGERKKAKDERETLRYTQSDVNNGEKKKPFVFVTTCRLVPVKNLDRLITAFARLCDEFSEIAIELWIVGDGPLRETLENQSKELGVSDKVKFWGFQENVFLFLEKADVFVLPSLSEG
ncbi:MAG: glycosyltransferase, partial [Cyclobacteriaceae bacterium]|nr:glycosyltransferase [Cyclobacteriaceae bacterium]